MPTQEERLTTVEQAQVRVGEAVSDLNHHVTMLIVIVQRQEWDIREIKGSLRTIDGSLGSFGQRLGSFDQRLGSFDQRLGSFEQNVNSRFEVLESRFETLDKKFDQMLHMLASLTGKSDQETE